MFCVFSITTGEFVVAGLLPTVAADLGTTVGTAGLAVPAYALGMIIGGPLLTALTAHLRRRPLMVALLGVAVVGNAASAAAPTLPVLLTSRVLTALVTSTFFAQAVVAAIRAAPPGRSGGAVAKLAFGMNLAMIAGAPLGTLIGDRWGWRATFIAIGAGCLIGAALVRTAITVDGEGPRSSALAELRVLRRPEVLWTLALTALGNIGVLTVFTYLAPLATRVAGLAATAVPLLLLGYGLGATMGNLLGGAAFDRAPRSSPPTLLAALTTVLALGWIFAESPVGAVAAIVALGVAGFAIIPGMQARVMAAAASAPTLAMAVNASGYQLAAAGGGVIGGAVTDSAAGPRPIYLIAACLTASALIISALRLRRPAQLAAEPR